MLILDNMPSLEGEILGGLALKHLINLSAKSPIKFDNGIIEINGLRIGTRGVALTKENYEEATKCMLQK